MANPARSADIRVRPAAPADPLDVALRLGVLALENGGSAGLAERAFDRVLAAGGITDGFAVWRLDAVTAGRASDHRAVVRPVGRVGINLARVSAIGTLIDRPPAGELTVAGAAAEAERIAQLGMAYPTWLIVVATAASAALFARGLNGEWTGTLAAGVAAALGQCVRVWLSRARSPLESSFAAAVVSAVAAAIGLHLRLVDVAPGTIVASIIYLVPGLPLINGFFDVAVSRHLVLGVQRLISAMVVMALLAVAVALAAAIMR